MRKLFSVDRDGRVTRAVRDLVVVLAITVALGEVVLRAYTGFVPVPFLYDDSYNRFRGTPFAEDWDFKLNSRGFKDIEFAAKAGYRVVALGDSFAFGVVPYERNYLTLIEAGLRRVEEGADVLNLGIPDTGPDDYLALFVREGSSLDPDLVLVSLFVGNDLTDPASRKRAWYERSYVVTLLRYGLALRPKYEGRVVHGKATYCDTCPSLDEETFLEVEARRSRIFFLEDAKLDRLTDRALAPIRALSDLCRARGIGLLVVVIPDQIQVDAGLREAVRRRHFADVPSARWNPARPNERLTARLREAEIDHLDLLPAFAAEGGGRSLYKPRDTHWNVAGNALAARLVQAHVEGLMTLRRRPSPD